MKNSSQSLYKTIFQNQSNESNSRQSTQNSLLLAGKILRERKIQSVEKFSSSKSNNKTTVLKQINLNIKNWREIRKNDYATLLNNLRNKVYFIYFLLYHIL